MVLVAPLQRRLTNRCGCRDTITIEAVWWRKEEAIYVWRTLDGCLPLPGRRIRDCAWLTSRWICCCLVWSVLLWFMFFLFFVFVLFFVVFFTLARISVIQKLNYVELCSLKHIHSSPVTRPLNFDTWLVLCLCIYLGVNLTKRGSSPYTLMHSLTHRCPTGHCLPTCALCANTSHQVRRKFTSF